MCFESWLAESVGKGGEEERWSSLLHEISRRSQSTSAHASVLHEFVLIGVHYDHFEMCPLLN